MVKISHVPLKWGRSNLYTVYYHMKENSRTLQAGDWVNRGDVIGYEGAPYNMHVKHYLYQWSCREQPNNFGENMSFMEYYDGSTRLENTVEEVEHKKETQFDLIREFLSRYIGPGKKIIGNIESYTLMHNGAWSDEDHHWSFTELFKLGEFIFRKEPQLFRGTDNERLVSRIYNNQPIILTLPMLKS